MLQVGTRGNPNAEILIVGEAYGSTEHREGQPFVGTSGQELDAMLQEAGLDPANCYFTNVVNKQPPSNNMTKFFVNTKSARAMGVPCIRGLYPDIPVLEGLAALEKLIAQLKPKVIVAFGNYALWALSENDYRIGNGSKANGTAGYKVPTGMVQYRGSHLRSRFGNIPLVPTYHPAAVLRNYEWRFQVVHDLRARVRRAVQGLPWDEPERNYIIRPSVEDVLRVMNKLILRAELSHQPLLVTCDIETLRPHIECVGFAWSRQDAICVPIMCHDKWAGYWSPEEESIVVEAMRKVLEHPNIFIAGQNFFYDYQYLCYYWAIQPNYKHDTMLAHHVCYPGSKLSLDYLSSLYCEYHCYWKDDGKESSKTHNDDQRWTYNCRDCCVTYEVIESEWEVIKHYDMGLQYAIQMNRANAAASMMMRGVRIDEKRRGEERLKHIEVASEYEHTLDAMVPESVYPRKKGKAAWYNSPTQLSELFYDALGQHVNNNRKSGSVTTDDDALKKIGMREPLLKPLTTKLQEFRSLEVFGQFLNMKVGPDGRMRALFSPTTETFRYRSGEDVFGFGRNLQNLPKGNEEEDD